MSKRIAWSGLLALAILACALPGASAEDITLDLRMPASIFYPGDPCWLDLDITNQGPAVPDADLLVLMDLRNGYYLCYPSWSLLPPDLDWLDMSVPAAAWSTTLSILPSFSWPQAGEGSGIRFWSAMLSQGEIISNVDMVEFGWAEDPPAPGWSYIPAGSYLRGSPESEDCRFTSENQVQVTLTRGFQMQQTEVTQAEWVAVFGSNPSVFEGDQRPVENITWYDACIYCNRLSVAQGLRPCYYSDLAQATMFDGTPPVIVGEVYWDKTADGYRLPTESEWEHACRAGTTTAYNNGLPNLSCIEEDMNLNPIAWYVSICWETQIVGQKQPNAWGLHDMLGNVWEFTWERFEFNPPPGPLTDYTGSDEWSDLRSRRGGSWYFNARYCRSAIRTQRSADESQNTTGLRLVR